MAENTQQTSDKAGTTGKPYELIEYKGVPARLYESGLILSHDNGSIMKPAERTLMTRSSALKLVQHRKELAAQRVQDAIMRQISKAAGEDFEDFESAWGALMGRMAEDSYNREDPLHSRVKAAELAGKAADVLQDRRVHAREAGPDDTTGALLSVLGALAAAFQHVLVHDNSTKHDETNVLDIEVIDTSEPSTKPVASPGGSLTGAGEDDRPGSPGGGGGGPGVPGAPPFIAGESEE